MTARPTTPEETAALAAEAEAVYREHQRLMDEYDGQGGAETLPEPLKAYVGGHYASAVEASLRFSYTEGRRIVGRTQIAKVAVFPPRWEGSLVGLEFCDDRTHLVHVAKDGQRTPLNTHFSNKAEFSRGPDGKLRMTDNVSDPVETCGA